MSLREQFNESGYVIINGILAPDTITHLKDECTRLTELVDIINHDNFRCRWNPHLETGELLLDSLDPVADLSPVIADITRNPKIINTLTEIYGEAPRLFKDKLLFKPSGCPGYALHQDYISWPEFPKSFLTVAIAIDGAHEDNGCLEVYEGAHKRGYLSPHDGDYHDLPPAYFTDYAKKLIRLNPGDAVIFGPYLPHGSGHNLTGSPRRHLYLSYNSASAGDLRESHYQYFTQWLKNRYAGYGYATGFFK